MAVAPGMFQRMPESFEALTDEGFAAGFYGAGADEHAVLTEVGVAHSTAPGDDRATRSQLIHTEIDPARGGEGRRTLLVKAATGHRTSGGLAVPPLLPIRWGLHRPSSRVPRPPTGPVTVGCCQ